MKNASWLNHPALQSIDPRKKTLIINLLTEVEGKPLEMALPAIMQTNQQLSAQGLSFTPQERNVIFEVMSQDLPPMQRSRMEMFWNMMNNMSGGPMNSGGNPMASAMNNPLSAMAAQMGGRNGQNRNNNFNQNQNQGNRQASANGSMNDYNSYTSYHSNQNNSNPQHIHNNANPNNGYSNRHPGNSTKKPPQ